MVLVLRARQVERTRGLEGNHLSNFPTLYAVKRAQTNFSLWQTTLPDTVLLGQETDCHGDVFDPAVPELDPSRWAFQP